MWVSVGVGVKEDTQSLTHTKTLPKFKPIKGAFELHEISSTKHGLLVSKNKSSDRDILTRINFFI